MYSGDRGEMRLLLYGYTWMVRGSAGSVVIVVVGQRMFDTVTYKNNASANTVAIGLTCHAMGPTMQIKR